MTHFTHFVEKMFWGSVGLAVALIVMYAFLHAIRVNAGVVPVVGAPVASGTSWVAAHTVPY